MLKYEELELGLKSQFRTSRPPNPNVTFKPAIDLNPNCGKWGQRIERRHRNNEEGEGEPSSGRGCYRWYPHRFCYMRPWTSGRGAGFRQFWLPWSPASRKTTKRITAINDARKAAEKKQICQVRGMKHDGGELRSDRAKREVSKHAERRTRSLMSERPIDGWMYVIHLEPETRDGWQTNVKLSTQLMCHGTYLSRVVFVI